MNDSKRVLITGCTGMLGCSVIEEFMAHTGFEIYGISRNDNENKLLKYIHRKIDLTDFISLKQLLNDIKPDIIIHCAAIVNVDSCEENKENAYKLHVKATEILASYNCENTKFIYISTDSVYDGCSGNYKEIDKTNPLNYYAKTKLQGETAALKINPNTIVIRTNIYGFHVPKGKSLVEWAIEYLSQNKDINGFGDVYFNPVYVGQLAEIIKYLCTEKEYKGILNVGCSEYVSKYDFLQKLAQQFLYSKTIIHETSVDDVEFRALRPKNTTLNIDILKQVYIKIPSIEAGLFQLKKDIE